MVDLLIRNIRVDTHQALRRLAADRNSSLGDEARLLLEAATKTSGNRLTPEKIAEIQAFRESLASISGPDSLDLLHEGRHERTE